MTPRYVLDDSEKLRLKRNGAKRNGKLIVRREPMLSSNEKTEIKKWKDLSGIFNPSKVNKLNKNIIQEIIRLVLFENPLSKGNKDCLRKGIDDQMHRFLNKIDFYRKLSDKDRELVGTKNRYLLIFKIHTNVLY